MLKPSQHTFGILYNKHQHYHAHPAPGTTLEDVLKPTYWMAVGHLLNPWDRITTIFGDRSLYLELLVIDCRHDGRVQVQTLYSLKPQASKLTDLDIESDVDIYQDEDTRRWLVKRKKDGVILNGGGDLSRMEAELANANHATRRVA